MKVRVVTVSCSVLFTSLPHYFCCFVLSGSHPGLNTAKLPKKSNTQTHWRRKEMLSQVNSEHPEGTDMRSAFSACSNMTIIQLQGGKVGKSHHKETKTTQAECKCYFTREEKCSREKAEEKVLGRVFFILLTGATSSWTLPDLSACCWEQICFCSKSLQLMTLMTHINYKYKPRMACKHAHEKLQPRRLKWKHL